MNSENQITYELSPQQIQMLQVNQVRTQHAAEELRKEEESFAELEKLFEARRQLLEAKRAALRSEQSYGRTFLSYIINDFKLPETKDNRGWQLQKLAEDKYVLVAEKPDADPKPQPES